MNCIVNVSQNWGIGNKGSLLVRLSRDLRFFREKTEGCAVVLGRKTLASFPGGKPLPNRTHVVLSRTCPEIEEVEICRSLSDALARIAEIEKTTPCWLIGGEQIYRQFLPYCELALVTKTEIGAPADAFFPDLDEDPNWQCVSESERFEENGVGFRFLTYRNLAPKPLAG